MTPDTKPATVVISCGAAKLDHPAAARNLYTGALFRQARAAAVRDGRPWVILSALHGFLHPDEVVEPYDHTVRTQTDRAHLAQQVQATRNKVREPLEMWCPARYVDVVRGQGLAVAATPLQGLRMGEQTQWLSRHAQPTTAPPPPQEDWTLI